MRKAREKEWVDYLGSSALPEDAATYTDGSNYMLDGFQFDSPANEGVLEGARLPETRGVSALPDGFICSSAPPLDPGGVLDDPDSGFDLGGMLSENEGCRPVSAQVSRAASLVNLDWLDPTQPQDPKRLPKELRPDRPPLNSVPELEEAWGMDRRTDGVQLVPNKDLDALRYEKSLEKQDASKLPGDRIASAMRRAVRLAHYGTPMQDIKRGLVAELGHDAKHLRKAVDRLESEWGLLGKVFVRASAFPGIKTGKWVQEIKRFARTARYVVTEDDGVASRLSMIKVAEVPWQEALSYYRPRLVAAGFRVASGNPRVALRRALLEGPRIKVPTASPKPQDVVLPKPAPSAEMLKPIQLPNQRAAEQKMRAALQKVARWSKEGSLANKDALYLYDQAQAGLLDHRTVLREAAARMTSGGTAKGYAGPGTNAKVPDSMRAYAAQEDQQAQLAAKLMQSAKQDVVKAVKIGQLTREEARRIVAKARDAASLRALTAAAIQAAPRLRKLEVPTAETAPYRGTKQSAAPQFRKMAGPKHSTETQRVIAAAKAGGVKAGEIQGLLKWARVQMSEGLAGNGMNTLLRVRFSPVLLKAASELLTEIRGQHEGVSGHVYVDAAAYASPQGVSGCERGALRHRATPVKYVLAMDRCGSCTMNSSGVCLKYNKRVVDKPPVKDLKAFQKESLRMIDAPDNVQTAALFDPKGYQLDANPLENIEFDPNAPTETLSEVLFGGMELG